MAQLGYTLSTLMSHVAHALGRTPDSRTSPVQIVNRALGYVQNFHNWNWRITDDTPDFTISQSYVLLPVDFGELEALIPAGNVNLFERVDWEQLILLRQNTLYTDPWHIYYCLRQHTQTDTAAPPRWRLDIAPTPAATVSDAFTVVYRRNIAVMATTADDAKVPNAPDFMQDPILETVRAFARLTEEIASPEASPGFQLANQLLRDAVAHDARAAGVNLGRLRPGVRRRHVRVSGGFAYRFA